MDKTHTWNSRASFASSRWSCASGDGDALSFFDQSRRRTFNRGVSAGGRHRATGLLDKDMDRPHSSQTLARNSKLAERSLEYFNVRMRNCVSAGSIRSNRSLSRPPPYRDGPVRNIRVLGVIKGRLAVAYQGNGKVRTCIDVASSSELIEKARTDWGDPKYHQLLQDSHKYRFAEYAVPPLPTTVVSQACTCAEQKPRQESRARAKIGASGQVVSSLSFVYS